MAGGTHAFIETIARLRAENPGLSGRQAVRLYVDQVAPLAYRNSCLFHGATGCTLDRSLRAELCNRYYCNGLEAFLKADVATDVTVVTQSGEERVVAVRPGADNRRG
jgi:hypothetical protein